MNIHENVATQAIASFFYHEALWKKEILFNFLLEPYEEIFFEDIESVTVQDNLKSTIPDFTIITKANKRIRYEVKINNVGLTKSETDEKNRDVFLIRKDYSRINEIPEKCKKLYWDDLFKIIDEKGATKDFAKLDLIREYINYSSILLTPHEVAMLYSPETVTGVYSMSEKVLNLCKSFLDSNSKLYKKCTPPPQQNENGIGYYFAETKEKKRNFFIGLSPTISDKKYSFSIALELEENMNYDSTLQEGGYAFLPLNKEILSKYDSDDELQEAFNKNVEEVIKILS